jgi:cyanophycin synthetase
MHRLFGPRFFSLLILWRRVVSALVSRRRTVYVGDRVDEYRSLWSAAAGTIGAEFTSLTPDVWEVRSGSSRTRISNDLVELDDPVVLDIAGDKSFCYGLADGLGVPTPGPQTFRRGELGDVLRTFRLDGQPYVVKPAKGTGSGVGVTVGVRSRLDLANGLALAAVHSGRVIVERLVAAETVRLLFLDGVMIHAVRRRGVRVVGDGSTTIEGLVGRLGQPPVAVDAVVTETIRQAGRSLADVPPAGEGVVVRWLPAGNVAGRELRTIYDEDVTGLVSPGLVAEIAPLMAAVGSRFAGIDLLTNDPTRTLAETGGVFLEVNTTPGLHHHCAPSRNGESCVVAERVLRSLLALEAS